MLSLEILNQQELQTYKLEGNLEGMEALDLRNNLTKSIEQKARQVTVDLTKVDSMDLTGFNALVMIKKEVIQNGRKFTLLVNNDNPVHDFIQLSKLTFNISLIKNS